MRYRILGKTGLNVSELSFGTAPILDGFKSYDEMMPKFYRLTLKESTDVLRKAYHEGINFYDTATVNEYGDAEYKLGYAFKSSSSRSEIIIGSRARRYDYEGMKAAIECSLKTLNTEYIDIFYIHQVNPDVFQLALDEECGAIRAMREYQQKGVITHLGITSHYVSVFEKSLDFDDLVVHQFPQNLMENGFYPRLRGRVEENNIGTVPMKIYGAGPLLEVYEKPLLISYILNNLNTHTALIGIGTMEQLIENLSAYEQAIKNTEEYALEVDRVITDLISKKQCNRCQVCECPKDIRISHLLRYRAYYHYYNYQSFSVDRYNKLKTGADACDKCMCCEKSCPIGLPIVEYLEDAHRVLSRNNKEIIWKL
ncbi:hypothetical protein FHR92_003346 [Fontibacillus solani]|uniref:4Fe-4S ferredoxin-type domain-containing protein n=1 Tax=Fontibacillus solani TaxID=1572857 RepID=A0A7W3SV73_9BACL|nr:aldo/keto reductase [Fontibacillus solani]MBA9086866.1 hypothetical protein [Fontibacillus solani]